MLRSLFFVALAVLALVSPTDGQACNPGGPQGKLADGSCDPYVPPVNLASPSVADHTTNVAVSSAQVAALNNLTNFVFLILSEDTFDNLMATFPGVNNLQSALSAGQVPVQTNWTTGVPYSSFPADPTNSIPAGLPNAPYNIITQSGIPGVSLSTIFSNPSHNYHQTQLKINGGANNGWIYWSAGKSATMGMVGTTALPLHPTATPPHATTHRCSRTHCCVCAALSVLFLRATTDLSANPNSGIWGIGQKYTVFDQFFAGSFGDQTCAHMYTVGAAPPPFDSSNPGVCPSSLLSQSQWFAPTAYNGSLWLLTDPTTQPALSRDCYLIGDVVSDQMCDTGGDLVFPQIPNSVSNPKHFGDLLDGASGWLGVLC